MPAYPILQILALLQESNLWPLFAIFASLPKRGSADAGAVPGPPQRSRLTVPAQTSETLYH